MKSDRNPNLRASSTMDFRMRLTMFLRSLSLQASWNKQRMQNLGLLACLLPWLRRQASDINEHRLFCRRYYEYFNTNPYLGNFLLGGLIRLEQDKVEGEDISLEMRRTFRDSLARAFASLGDQLFWLGIRPALLMSCCLLGLWGLPAGILILVGVFAGAQLVLRWISLGHGYRVGLDIVELLGHPNWHRSIDLAKRTGMVATGLFIGFYVVGLRNIGNPFESQALWLGMGLGTVIPLVLRKRLPGEILLMVALGLALFLAFAI